MKKKTEEKEDSSKDTAFHYKTTEVWSAALEKEDFQEIDNFIWDIHKREISKYKVLTPQEERILARKAKVDKEAREKFILSNLRLVHSIAKRYQGLGLDFLDLVQEGYIGLIKAVENYNPELGYKFSTYATWWIRQAITRAIANLGSLIRIPVHLHEKIAHIRKIEEEFEERFQRKPRLEELAEYSGIDMKNLLEIRRCLFKVYPLDVPIKDLPIEDLEENSELLKYCEDDLCIQDLLPDDLLSDEENFEEEIEREEILEKILGVLSEREREVLMLRYGLKDGTTRTLAEVGEIFGLTRERIRQIEEKAIRHLRHPPRKKRLKNLS